MKNKFNKFLIFICYLVEDYTNQIKSRYIRKNKLKELERVREEARFESLKYSGRKYYILYNHKKQLVIRTRKQIQHLQKVGIYRKGIGAKELMNDAVDVIQNGLSISERGKKTILNPNKK